jgi:hypothetical protein
MLSAGRRQEIYTGQKKKFNKWPPVAEWEINNELDLK